MRGEVVSYYHFMPPSKNRRNNWIFRKRRVSSVSEELKPLLNSILEAVQVNSAKLDALDMRVGSLEGRVGSFENKVDSMGAEVKSLKLEVRENTRRLTRLEEKQNQLIEVTKMGFCEVNPSLDRLEKGQHMMSHRVLDNEIAVALIQEEMDFKSQPSPERLEEVIKKLGELQG
jgi:hypothetical protein